MSRKGSPVNNRIRYKRDIEISIISCIEALEKAAEEYWYTCKDIASVHNLKPAISKEQWIEQKLAQWLEGYPCE